MMPYGGNRTADREVGEFQDASGNDDDDTGAAPAGLRSAVSAGPRASGSHGFDSRACPFRASVPSLHFSAAPSWGLGVGGV